MDAAIAMHGLTKWYGRRLGVEDVTFDVASGSVTGFLGPNGSGKTTVLRMLTGLISITRGSASLLGADVATSPASVRASVGYLPGVLGLPRNESVRSHLSFLARMRRIDAVPRALELCERFGLPPDDEVSSLSKGTRQKLGVVQAFMHSPRVLLLDEPTSGLDPIAQREFERLLAEARDDGAAVLLSSHVMHEVEVLASRVAIIDEGRLLVVDDMSELKARTARKMTFSFPGLVDASVFARLRGVRSVVPDGRDLSVTVVGSAADLLHAAGEAGAETIVSHEPSLEDVFYDVTEGRR